MSFRKFLAAVSTAALAATTFAMPAQAADISITGSGSSFVSNYLEACRPIFTAAEGVGVTYNPTGSGTGRSQFTSKVVDFAASDTAFGSTEKKPAEFGYVPLVAGPIAIMYNLPTLKYPLNLTQENVAEIFAGKITKWNDAKLVANNKTVKVTAVDPKTKKKATKTVKVTLPNLPIKVYYRSDKSGTSEVFTDYLSTVAPTVFSKGKNGTFASAVPNIPTDGSFQGASGSDGVATGAKSSVGAITYGEISFAKERKLAVANVRNEGGVFMAPTAKSASAFLSDSVVANGAIKVNFKNTDKAAYNISAFAYGLVYTAGQDAAKAAAVKKFFSYMVSGKCTAEAGRLGYAPVSGAARSLAIAMLDKL